MEAQGGVSLRSIRALAIRGWAAGIVIACALMIPAPPTAQFGAWGWAAGVGVQALSAICLLTFIRHRRRVGPRALAALTWLLPVDLGAMQWLGGGWDAPYHELLLPALILGSAWMPPRRFAPFAFGVAVIALLPALYAPDPDGLLGIIAELSVWLFVTTALSMLMARIRGQARLLLKLAGCKLCASLRFSSSLTRASLARIPPTIIRRRLAPSGLSAGARRKALACIRRVSRPSWSRPTRRDPNRLAMGAGGFEPP